MNQFISPYPRIHSARKWTFEHLYCLLLYFIIFALPFYFSFAGKSIHIDQLSCIDFWFDEQYGMLEIRYYYSGYYAVEVEYVNGTTGGSQSVGVAVVPSSTIAGLRGLTVEVEDGTEMASFVFRINGFASQITGVNVITYWDVEVPALKRVVSAGYAVSVPGNLQIASVAAQMSLQPASPFNALTTPSTTTINRPAYFDTSYRSPNSYPDLLSAHLQNPYKLQTEPTIQTPTPSPTTPPTRTLTLTLLKDTQKVLPYYPPMLETLKFKFSTYFGMLMLSYLIFRYLLLLLVRDQALECHQRDEVPAGVTGGTYL